MTNKSDNGNESLMSKLALLISLITQRDLAARLEVLGLEIDQAKISKIEQGIRPVFDYELAKIAEALKVSVAWLYGKTDDSSETSTKKP
jgi:transcriptional regulator with XRE-family HTH domain